MRIKLVCGWSRMEIFSWTKSLFPTRTGYLVLILFRIQARYTINGFIRLRPFPSTFFLYANSVCVCALYILTYANALSIYSYIFLLLYILGNLMSHILFHHPLERILRHYLKKWFACPVGWQAIKHLKPESYDTNNYLSFQ